MILAVNHIQKSFVTHEVLKDISFHLEEKEKAALIGINGTGKTTLFQILLGMMEPDGGSLYVTKGLRIGYLPQNPDYHCEKRIEEELLGVFAPLRAMEDRMHELERQIENAGAPQADLLEEYSTLQHRYAEEDGYQYASRVRGVLKGLGFSEAEYQLPVSMLSGGQRSRVALAKLLLEKPDLLLLDEPTNHLDIRSIAWLEGYLASFPGSAIIISHDRYFLDKLCTKTIEIERGCSSVYRGNYSFFVEAKELKMKSALREYNAQQEEIRRQEEIIARLRSYGREKHIRRARSREKLLEKMDRLDRPTPVDSEMKLHFTPSILSGEDVLTAEALRMDFDGSRLFENVDFTIHRGEKVALIGANGTGKTTLFRLILGFLSPTGGYLTTGVKVECGYYDQQQENLHPSSTILDEIYDAYPDMTLGRIRSVLGAFLFRGDDVFKTIGTLSGGEKARVSLCKIMLGNANFLLLDEPTNHLDIESREILEDNLIAYEGTLFFISHDRYFINRVADKIFELTPDGIRVYLGDYDFYLEHRAQETAEEQTRQAPSSNKNAFLQQKQQQRELTQKKTRLQRLEALIADDETRLQEIDAQMLDPKYYSSASAFAALEKEQKELNQALEEHMEEWSTLSDELESLS